MKTHSYEQLFLAIFYELSYWYYQNLMPDEEKHFVTKEWVYHNSAVSARLVWIGIVPIKKFFNNINAVQEKGKK